MGVSVVLEENEEPQGRPWEAVAGHAGLLAGAERGSGGLEETLSTRPSFLGGAFSPISMFPPVL